jgi:hypothetical protein
LIPQRDPVYLKFVASQPCVACGAPAEPHHTKKSWFPVSVGGTSMTGSDYCTIPLCRTCHTDAHQMGAEYFEARHGLCIDRMIVFTLVCYIRSLT